jgi:hypothetical protein
MTHSVALSFRRLLVGLAILPVSHKAIRSASSEACPRLVDRISPNGLGLTCGIGAHSNHGGSYKNPFAVPFSGACCASSLRPVSLSLHAVIKSLRPVASTDGGGLTLTRCQVAVIVLCTLAVA